MRLDDLKRFSLVYRLPTKLSPLIYISNSTLITIFTFFTLIRVFIQSTIQPLLE